MAKQPTQASAPANANPKQAQNGPPMPPNPRGRSNPAAQLGKRASQAAQAVGSAAKDAYNSASFGVPGVVLRQGLSKAKDALQKITKR